MKRSTLFLTLLFVLFMLGGVGASAQTDDLPMPIITDDNSDTPLAPQPTPQEATHLLQARTPQSSSVINLDAFRADQRFAGIDGSGVAVVVIDGGIDVDDPFFGPDENMDGISDRIVYQQDFAEDDMDASDNNGHGSNVSSIIGSSDETHTGMAPAVNIIHLKVFTDDNDGSFTEVEEALQWVIANAAAYNVVSVNMSLGEVNGGFEVNLIAPQQRNGVGDELDALRNTLGIPVVSSSGNEYFFRQGVTYPAADPNSMAVGAVFDADIGPTQVYSSGAQAFSSAPDRIAPFSRRHETMSTIFAPGLVIVGAGHEEGLTAMEGTSQAAPHVSGVIALMQELALQELGRLLTPDEMENLLVSTGAVINDGDDEDDNVTHYNLNFRRLDVLAAGEALLAMADEVAPTITAVNAITPSGSSELEAGAETEMEITQLTVDFSEPMLNPVGNDDANDVTNPANYVLLSGGENGVVETAVCATPAADDQVIAINSVSYSNNLATLALNDDTPLPPASYQFAICGDLRDEAGNAIADTFILSFTVQEEPVEPDPILLYLPIVQK